MANKIASDPRVDPRIKAAFGDMPEPPSVKVDSREVLLASMKVLAESPELSPFAAVLRNRDFEALAPSDGLDIRTEEITSSPEGNRIILQIIRPESEGPLPCVYYIHGGGMAMMSAFDPHYSAWGRMIARKGVAVVMVEFRNSLMPGAVSDIAPYPGGLNDCVSGLRWVLDNAGNLGIDSSRVVVSGDSGGGNLTMATGLAMKQAGEASRIKGLYALCPYLKGIWSDADGGSVVANGGLLMELRYDNGAVAYGKEAFDAKDPLAWPGFASEADLEGLPPVRINVNECDPLLDEGIELYRRLIRAGVSATCRTAIGTIHSTETFLCCPDISEALARDIAGFATG